MLPDLQVSCPWLPELDGARFDDLCDDDRLQVAKYLMTIFRKSGKEDNTRILSSAVSTSGGPLRSLEEGAPALPLRRAPVSRPPSIPPEPQPAPPAVDGGLPSVSPPVGAGSADDVDPPAEAPNPQGPAWHGAAGGADEPFMVHRKTLPVTGQNGDIVEGDAGWFFRLDGNWHGPRKDESFARRGYEAVLEDRAAAQALTEKRPRVGGRS